jgi:hypothetical protein
VQTENQIDHEAQEQAGYFEVPGAHLYTVLHRVEQPLARLLLIGPFAWERHNAYIPLVWWARYLAQRGVEVLRYDYRGIGESTGVFEELSFEHWSDDIRLLAAWLKEQSPDVPLVLHGLEIGGLLAARASHSGIGDLLLTWSAPMNANQVLRSTLLRWVVPEQLFKYGSERTPASAYIAQLEQGSSLEVEGYQWSPKLWRDSFDVVLPVAMGDEASARSVYKKPVRVVKLGREAAPLVKSGSLMTDDPKDLSWLFAENWGWMAAALGVPPGGKK